MQEKPNPEVFPLSIHVTEPRLSERLGIEVKRKCKYTYSN